jgi:cytochrome c553
MAARLGMTNWCRARTGLRISVIVVLGAGLMGATASFPQYFTARNTEGSAATLLAGDGVSVNHPFFRSLGTNGRACVTCHVPAEGWSVTPAGARARFNKTQGLDPLFRTNDGATSPVADVSTVRARRSAYGLLLSKGLIRVGLPVPAGAEGGPHVLVTQPFWPGINSSQDPTGTPPTLKAFTLFDAWTTAVGRHGAARQAIARGQEIFNGKTFTTRASTCSSCHNAPNAGSNSTALFFNVGVSAAEGRTPDLPLYTFRCVSGSLAGQTRVTTDPGLALITGRCQDIGKFKVPTLRGLAARPPYFHNGAAATLDDVVVLYDQQFGIGLTLVEQSDLVAFLRAL